MSDERSEPLDQLVAKLARTRPALDDLTRARVAAGLLGAIRAGATAARVPRPPRHRRQWIGGIAVAASLAAAIAGFSWRGGVVIGRAAIHPDPLPRAACPPPLAEPQLAAADRDPSPQAAAMVEIDSPPAGAAVRRPPPVAAVNRQPTPIAASRQPPPDAPAESRPPSPQAAASNRKPSPQIAAASRASQPGPDSRVPSPQAGAVSRVPTPQADAVSRMPPPQSVAASRSPSPQAGRVPSPQSVASRSPQVVAVSPLPPEAVAREPSPPAAEPAVAPLPAAPERGADRAARYTAAERKMIRDPIAARDELRALVAEAPGERQAAQALLDLARLAIQSGDAAAARDALDRLAAHPDRAPLAMSAAYVRCILERDRATLRACLIEFRAAFPDSPSDPDVLARLAVSLASSGDCDAARPLLVEYRRRYPRGSSAATLQLWRDRCAQ